MIATACEHAPQQSLPADERATIIRVSFNTFLRGHCQIQSWRWQYLANSWLTALDG
jgi:hypothetical protein